MCLYRANEPTSALTGGDRSYGYRSLVTAHAVGAAHHDGPSVLGARDPKVFRVSGPRPGPDPAAGCPRLARAGWRRTHPDRSIHSTSRLHSRRRYGRRLLLRARAERLLSDAQHGPVGNSFLLRISLSLRRRRRCLERRPAAGVVTLAVNAQAEARRRLSILAFISGPGQSSCSQSGSGSPGPLTFSVSSWSARPSGNSSRACGSS